MTYYILIHEYYDKSGFSIRGLTTNELVARAWDRGNTENHVYVGRVDDIGDRFTRWPKKQEKGD